MLRSALHSSGERWGLAWGRGVTAQFNGSEVANLVADDEKGLAYARSYHQVRITRQLETDTPRVRCF